MINQILGGTAGLILRALAALWQAFDRLMERLFPKMLYVTVVLTAVVVWSHFQPAQARPAQPLPAVPDAAPAPPAGYELKGGQMVPIPGAG